MPEQKKRGGCVCPASAANGSTSDGRPPSKATVVAGNGVFITQVYADGTAPLGQGIALIRKIGDGNGRVIVLPQADGSEIRILIVT